MLGGGAVVAAFAALGVAWVMAQDTGSIIVTNSAADTNERDEKLTLREAVMLSEGTLDPLDLDDTERAQIVTGTPGKGKGDEIKVDVDPVVLTRALPDITDDDTTIVGTGARRRTIDGGNKLAVGLMVKARRFAAENVRLENFTEGDGMKIAPQAATTDLSYRLQKLQFFRTQRGLVIEARGSAKMNYTLADIEEMALTH
jgi:hypothetical protein